MAETPEEMQPQAEADQAEAPDETTPPAAEIHAADEAPADEAPAEAAPNAAALPAEGAEAGEMAEAEEDDPAALVAMAATVEAILFATDTPLSPAKIAQVGDFSGRKDVKKAIALLNEKYEQMGCAFTIESIAGGYQMMTREEYHDVLGRLLRVKSESRLTAAQLETLAVVAYRQPIIRADIEAIRGVACGDMLRKLMERNLVKIVGRADVLGRPMLYGTTRRFLEVFGLNSLDDLPRVEELKGGAEGAKPGRPAPAQPADGAPAEADVAAGSDVAGTEADSPAEAQDEPGVYVADAEPEASSPDEGDAPGDAADDAPSPP